MCAAKLKDGLFLGDYETAQDLEFVAANKITRIINCAGREVGNAFERSGVQYLTYTWPESGNVIIFDDSNRVLDEIFGIIEEALEVGESVLIHSIDGASRAAFASAVYFILKYRWTLDKTMQYLRSKRPDLQPKPGFMRQLIALDQSLQRLTLQSVKSKDDPLLRRYSTWDTSVLPDADESDELLLTHTFLNSNPAPPMEPPRTKVPLKKKKLSWIDDPRRKPAGPRARVEVPISPYSRRPIPERPPGNSYSSLSPGVGWVDTLETSAAPPPVVHEPSAYKDTSGLKSICKTSRLYAAQKAEARRSTADSNPVGGPVGPILSGDRPESARVRHDAADIDVIDASGHEYGSSLRGAGPFGAVRTGWAESGSDTSMVRESRERPSSARPPSPGPSAQSLSGMPSSKSSGRSPQTRPRSAMPDPEDEIRYTTVPSGYSADMLSQSFDRSMRVSSAGPVSSSSGGRGPVRATVDLSGSRRSQAPGIPAPSSTSGSRLSTSFSEPTLLPQDSGYGSAAMPRRVVTKGNPHQKRGATPPRRNPAPAPSGYTTMSSAPSGSSQLNTSVTSLNASFDSRRFSSSSGDPSRSGYRAPSPQPQRSSGMPVATAGVPKRSSTPQPRTSTSVLSGSVTSGGGSLTRTGSGASLTMAQTPSSGMPQAKPRVRPSSPMGRVSSSGASSIASNTSDRGAPPQRSSSAKRATTTTSTPMSSYAYPSPGGYGYSSTSGRQSGSGSRWAL